MPAHSPTTIILSTQNPSKALQIKTLLNDDRFEVVSLGSLGITEEVIEDGETLEANARKKALFGLEKTGLCTIAEDTGLFIDALDGKPGIYAARWVGHDATTEEIVAHTLKELRGVPPQKRTATFKTVAVAAFPDGTIVACEGSIAGTILEQPRSTPQPGMHYSILFQPNGQDMVWAEMTTEEQNVISHRGQAFRQLRAALVHKCL
ncbi:MAG: hypothetical protein RL538_722 [Candidatus Parcubacteria bacterium]|jgi:XTP/dITP diphosphohydrolase